jgi:NTE family protein
MNRFGLVIAGGGLAAARAIGSYREAGGARKIALLAGENVLPYHRPALSKRYLRGEVGPPFVEDESFYPAHDVEVLLATPATGVNVRDRLVSTARGDFAYEQLLLATGATPRRLHVPGADLEGVHVLRTLEHSDAIRAAASSAERAVVVGGGFIGMEVAASLRQLGLSVTIVHLGRGLFDQFGSRELSDDLLGLYREQGVDVLLEHEVARFGGDGRLAYAETTNGRRIEADLAVVGVGVVPNVGFLDGSGLSLGDGVVVDERFATSAPGVYAVGDVASFFDPLYLRRRRIEHWSNANYQGREVGRILAGAAGGYESVSSFFSEVFGATIKVLGDTSQGSQVAVDGSLESGAFLARFADRGRLVGAIAVNQPEELETLAKELIGERAPVDALERELVGGGSR